MSFFFYIIACPIVPLSFFFYIIACPREREREREREANRDNVLREQVQRYVEERVKIGYNDVF
jgi:hypothetical protein